MMLEKHIRVLLSREAQQTLIQDVLCRRQVEACGVLLGHIDSDGNWHVEYMHPLRNIFNSPVYFEFDPQELLVVELSHPGQIVGVYHSHPTGYARASGTDQRTMEQVNCEQNIPWVWLILRGPFDDAFAQRYQHGLSDEMLIAYHHFAGEGLREIEIELSSSQDDMNGL